MSKIVICADYFTEVVGGAEKTFEVLSDSVIKNQGLDEKDFIKINSSKIDKDFINSNRDSTWLIGNYYFLIQNNLLELFNEIRYFIVEFDYKICPTRNFELYKHVYGKQYEYCSYSKAIDLFLSRAEKTFFMSRKQMDRHIEFCEHLSAERCDIAGSCFDKDFFNEVEKILEIKGKHSSFSTDFTAIYGQPTWQKGVGNAIFWCEKNDKPYKALFDMEYYDFLRSLAQCERLVFLPNGADTAPRTVMEARLLGLDLVLNDLVEHADEDWFTTKDLSVTTNHLKKQPEVFAEKIKI